MSVGKKPAAAAAAAAADALPRDLAAGRGFRVRSLGFRVSHFGLSVRSWVQGLVQSREFQVSGFGRGLMKPGAADGFRVWGVGVRVQGLGFRVQGPCRVHAVGAKMLGRSDLEKSVMALDQVTKR